MVLGEGVGLGHQSSMQRTSERAIEGGSALDITFSHILSFAILDQQQSSALLLLGREMLAIWICLGLFIFAYESDKES